ncbi:hypothetical protein D3C77_385280 [compost metagenome]
MHLADIGEVFTDIPMKPCSPDILGRFRIGQHNAGAFHHNIAVMIPDQNIHVLHARIMHHGAQIFLNEISFLLCTIDARIPGLNRRRLILNRNPPNRYAFATISFDKFRIITRPYLAVFRLQRSAVIHISVRFHPGRRAPRRSQHHNVSLSGSSSILN